MLIQQTFSLGKRNPVVYDFCAQRWEDAFGMKLYSTNIQSAMPKSHNRVIVSGLWLLKYGEEVRWKTKNGSDPLIFHLEGLPTSHPLWEDDSGFLCHAVAVRVEIACNHSIGDWLLLWWNRDFGALLLPHLQAQLRIEQRHRFALWEDEWKLSDPQWSFWRSPPLQLRLPNIRCLWWAVECRELRVLLHLVWWGCQVEFTMICVKCVGEVRQ